MENWYLIQTKVANENLAIENLENQNFTTYCPMVKIKNKVKALFPRYIFVKKIANQDISPVKSTKGVINIVRFGNDFAEVSAQIIQDLKSREVGIADKFIDMQSFHKGDDIEILEGVFAGNKAIFTSHSDDNRVILLLKLLGKEHRITLENNQVKKY